MITIIKDAVLSLVLSLDMTLIFLWSVSRLLLPCITPAEASFKFRTVQVLNISVLESFSLIFYCSWSETFDDDLMQTYLLCISNGGTAVILQAIDNINGLMQERRNSIANALELRLSRTNPSICHKSKIISYKTASFSTMMWLFFLTASFIKHINKYDQYSQPILFLF